ncbi:MAG: type II toxin-antitoxin system RelE/ParE family toxin [Bacteroidetes bacterium]|nr:type II toxin-antitoxin system RelE/ParE family toxin [Bacteroidota bacterium]
MNTIIWSDLAFLSFNDAVDYLTENYSLDLAIRFDEDVEKLLEKLCSFKNFCPPYEPRPVLRKCVVNRQVSLIYRVDGTTLHLITFFDNRGIHPF